MADQFAGEDDFFRSSEISVKAKIDHFAAEPAVLTAARAVAVELGAAAISAGVGSLLRSLVTAISAKHVVDLGTGVGVSAGWLSLGLAPAGTITSIDLETEYQHHAKELLAELGLVAPRLRLLPGRANAVLPKLTDAGYEFIFVDINQFDAAALLADAQRLLKPGGILVVNGALTSKENSATELVGLLSESEEFAASLVPLGLGLLIAARR
jgi:predicted O-methyltransferase YrrM